METEFRSQERFTQDEFREWLERRPASDINHYELLRGQIVMSPPAGWPHGGVGSRLNQIIGAHVDARRLGRAFDASTGYDLPSGDTLEPDVSFISARRFAAGPTPVRGSFLRIVPDLAIEILSDTSVRRDRADKREIYAENGVLEYWLVDTERCEVTVLHREGGDFGPPDVIAKGRIRSRVLPDLDADVESIFADLI